MTEDSLLRVLTMDRTPNDAEPLIDALRGSGYGIVHKYIPNLAKFNSELTTQEWDLVLCGEDLEGLEVAEIVKYVQEVKSGTAVVVVYDDAHKDRQAAAMGALLAGASDAVSRANPAHLQLVVNREMRRLALHRAHEKATRAFAEMQERCMILLESSQDAVAYVHQGMHVYANASYAKIFGYEKLEDLLGLPIMDMIVREQQDNVKKLLRQYHLQKLKTSHFETICVNAGGKAFDAKIEVAAVSYEGEHCLQVIVRGFVSEGNEQHHRNAKEHNNLYKLFDRQSFLKAMEESLKKTQNKTTLLCYLEIDDFDVLKQRLGIEAGEAVVLRVASVLKRCVPNQAMLARLSDGALALMCTAEEALPGAMIAEKIRQGMTEYSLADLSFGAEPKAVTCSIGIASVPFRTEDSGILLDEACAACRRASMLGGNRAEIWNETAVRENTHSLKSASVVCSALESGRVALLFQPIVSLHGDSTEMYEACLRVSDKDGNRVNTEELFVDAHKIDTVTKLDEWVIDGAVAILGKQQQQKGRICFFLRLSDHAVRNELLLLFLSEKLRGARLMGQLLTLQISETAVLQQTKHVRAFLNGLKPLGCRSAIEHVGLTLNSLDHLKELPVDYFKLHASLCQRLMKVKEGQAGVAAIVQLAKSMGVQTIATGVQEAACLSLLWQNGVDLAQGPCIQEPSEVLQYNFGNEN